MMPEYKVMVLGDGGVGKTALTIQLIENKFPEEHDPTVEDSYCKQVVIDGEPCIINVLDTAGQMEYTMSREQCMRVGEGFVIVFSVDEAKSLDTAEAYTRQVRLLLDNEKVPMVLVRNKCDLESRAVDARMALEKARSFNLPLIDASAKTREGVDVAFHAIIRKIRKQRVKELRKGSPRRHCDIL